MLRLERIRDDIAALGQHAALDQQNQGKVLALARRWLADLPDHERSGSTFNRCSAGKPVSGAGLSPWWTNRFRSRPHAQEYHPMG